jgi:hypothetical protein
VPARAQTVLEELELAALLHLIDAHALQRSVGRTSARDEDAACGSRTEMSAFSSLAMKTATMLCLSAGLRMASSLKKWESAAT